MLNIARDIDSLSNFKRKTSEFISQMKETHQPVVLTVNGKAELVVQDADSYQELLERLEYLESLAAIQKGLEDVEAGRTITLENFAQRMNSHHGI